MSSTAPLLESYENGGRVRESWLDKVVDVKEAKAQLLFSLPMTLTNTAYYAIPIVSVMFDGHLGDVELAGATLGNSWGAVTGYAVLTGLSGALETLCGQAYGAKTYRMLGIYLQSSLIMSALAAILVSVVWFFTEPILLFLHQDPAVAKMAATYLHYLIPGAFAFAFIQCILRYLQTQSMVKPLVVCSMVPFVIHIGLSFLLVDVFGLGLRGASISVSISFWISFAMLLIYVKRSGEFNHTWEGFSMEALEYVIPTLKLAIPSAIMICLEYWAFEILVLVAGSMPRSKLSTSLIAMCVNTEAITYMLMYGFSAAVSTRVSNEIGAGNIDKAKHVVSVTLKLSIPLGITIVSLLGFGHDLWASLFSKSHDVIEAYADMTPFLVCSILLDSAQVVLSGVARGCGWQQLAAWGNLVSFYLIGMPLGLFFAFELRFYAKGIWIGLICGVFCQTAILLIITLRTKWEKLALTVRDEETNLLSE